MAGGLAATFGVPPLLVRVAFVLLVTTGFLGPIAYLVAWLLSDPPPEDPALDPAAAVRVRLTRQQLVATGLVVLGVLLLLREIGLWIGDGLVWPLTLAALGSAVIWARAEPRVDRAAQAGSLLEGAGGVIRVIAGGVLVAGGLVAFVAANEALVAAGGIVVAVLVTVLGVGLIAGPWGVRLARQLAEERRERIRSEERAEMAAHLHDSVLHTLALIQRSGNAGETARLARAQERELRGWLYEGRVTGAAATLSDLVEEMAGRIEHHHEIKVEAVVVGDADLDDGVRALVDAAGEAATNAARHAGVPVVSVYVEAEPHQVTAFVRDEGDGFDPSVLPEGRHGIAHSIVGRMRRHGGRATILSEPGEGTEVQLELPRGPSGRGPDSRGEP